MIYIKQYYASPKLTEEALSVINEAYLEFKAHDGYNMVPLRVHNLLVNLAKARAMLLFKKIVDSDIAKSAVEYYSKISQNYLGRTVEPRDPIEEAILECKKFLSESSHQNSFGYTEAQLLERVCQISRQVDRYIKSGVSKKDYFDKANNKRARYILERLRVRYSEISVVSKRPVTLKWIPKLQLKTESHSDLSDSSDLWYGEGTIEKKPTMNLKSPNSQSEIEYSDYKQTQNVLGISQEAGSERSERSRLSAIEYDYICYICVKNQKRRFETNSKDVYQMHYIQKHPGMTAYPGKADLELHGWEPQNREWEL